MPLTVTIHERVIYSIVNINIYSTVFIDIDQIQDTTLSPSIIDVDEYSAVNVDVD